jgi:hypothetical protein
MLRVRGRPQRLCDGSGRRDFLTLGALGGLGLSLPTLLRAGEQRASMSTKDRQAGSTTDSILKKATLLRGERVE